MNNGAVVRKFKLWFVWQDEQLQRWLQQQAAQGLHLRSTNVLCLHTFVRGAPADMVYRWDAGDQRKDPHYMQLFQDAGWEHVASTVGWHCWRKARLAGQVNEIFTDSADKIRKYQRVMVPMLVILAVQLLTLAANPGVHMVLSGSNPAAATPIVSGAVGILVGSAIVLAYAVVKLMQRTAQLKRQRA